MLSPQRHPEACRRKEEDTLFYLFGCSHVPASIIMQQQCKQAGRSLRQKNRSQEKKK